VVALTKRCIEYGVDILRNFEAFEPTHLITADLKNILQIPAIISLHDVLYPPTILEYDHILTYVEWLREAIIEKYNYHNVTLLLNRIDENLFKPGPVEKIPEVFLKFSNRIVGIGRLNEEYKNISTLIKAMVPIIKEHPDTCLVLIGEGKDRAKYEAMIADLGLAKKVYLVGIQCQKMVIEYINWCDFHALLNPFGDIGRSLTESLMIGKPVLATGGKGNSHQHLVDGFNAKIVDFKNAFSAQSVAEGILYMIENKNNFDSQAIRDRAVSEYGYGALSKLEASVYDKVLRDYRGGKVWIFPRFVRNGKVSDKEPVRLKVFLKRIAKRILLLLYCQFGSLVQK
jgi:glycosyltransferase involved in cell wall biosynthesis